LLLPARPLFLLLLLVAAGVERPMPKVAAAAGWDTSIIIQ
jgi:hypothetical protein